jgi:hypothetical protein
MPTVPVHSPHPFRRSALRFLTATLLLSANLVAAPLDTADWKKHDKHLVVPRDGWTIYLHPDLPAKQAEETAKMLDLLKVQLDRVVAAVPAKALKHLQTVPIYINPTYEGQRPSAEYHPDAGWLQNNGRDPVMAKCIEITNVSEFTAEDIRMPYLLLHELSHAYHDQVLDFDDSEILKAFRKAAASGSYNSVKRFNGKTFSMDKAYAMSNHKEYFAETSEALFGKNDFYPFNLEELTKHDPTMLAVLRKKWGVTN